MWCKIPGHPGYEANLEGKIRNSKTGHVLAGVLTGPGRKQYLHVYAGGGRQAGKKSVHRLVALAFHGEPRTGEIACHHDGDTFNNSPDNVYWGTYSENTKDSIRHGTFVPMCGESNGNSKLSADAVCKIKQDYKGHRGQQSELARLYKVSVSTINLIVRGKIWA